MHDSRPWVRRGRPSTTTRRRRVRCHSAVGRRRSPQRQPDPYRVGAARHRSPRASSRRHVAACCAVSDLHRWSETARRPPALPSLDRRRSHHPAAFAFQLGLGRLSRRTAFAFQRVPGGQAGSALPSSMAARKRPGGRIAVIHQGRCNGSRRNCRWAWSERQPAMFPSWVLFRRTMVRRAGRQYPGGGRRGTQTAEHRTDGEIRSG